MKLIFPFFLFILLLCSCNSKPDHTVTIDNRYSLTLPAILSEAKNLNDDASLQYQNLFLEFYVIVIDEPKTELSKAIEENSLEGVYTLDLEGYTNIIMDGMNESIKNYKELEKVDLRIDNFPAKRVAFSGKVEGMDAFYVLTLVETNKRFYQIMSWTLAKHQDKYKPKMEKIMNSFNEL